MTDNQSAIEQLRRASDFATISAYLRRTLQEEVGAQYLAEATDTALASWELEQFGLYLADVEEQQFVRMREICDQMGHVPEGWRIPGRTDPH